jgi:2-(1,2-epoxy-1,2-dihydrophenyl)acetyl-CoA isomerase
MRQDDILLSRQGAVALLSLNRPHVLNSLSLKTIQALLTEIRSIADDPSIRALVVTGEGRGFCAGWQLEADAVPGIDGESLGVRQGHLMAEYFNPLIQALHELPQPTLAAVNGVCAGAGVSLALACDVVLIATSASFVLTFAPKLGLIPDLGATWKLPRLIGWARAQAVTMLGERITAAQAEQWGMVWGQVPDADLRRVAFETADRLARVAPGTCREVRLAYESAQTRDLVDQMECERRRQRVLLDAPAFAEGVAAFQQKREPEFFKDQR